MNDLIFAKFFTFIKAVSGIKSTAKPITFRPSFLFSPDTPSLTITNVGRIIPPDAFAQIIEEVKLCELQGALMNGELVFYPEDGEG
jgi:hypothetical protein